MEDAPTSTIDHRPGRKRLGPHDQRSYGARRLKRLTRTYLSDAGLATPTEAQKGACRRAAGATLQLEALEEALARGDKIDPLAYSRLDGVVRRNLRAIGLEESDPLSSPSGAMARGGASSRQKKVPLLSIQDWIREGTRARECVEIGPECVATVRASTVAALATAKTMADPLLVERLQQRLSSLDEAEEHWASLTPEQQEDEIDQRDWKDWSDEDRRRRSRGEESLPEPRNPHEERHTQAILDKNSENIKSFATHRDSPRRDE